MSLTLLLWLLAYATLAVLAFVRPVWGVALYFLSFFGDPAMWWWGAPIAMVRWNLMAAVIALGAVLVSGRPLIERHRIDWSGMLVLGIALNATFVHFVIAPDTSISIGAYTLLIKFSFLFFLIRAAVTDQKDLITLILVFVVALGHIGYEVKVNDAGYFDAGRLEGVGPATAQDSNSMGSLIATMLPLFGAALLCGTRRQQLLILLASPLVVNVLLMGKSRAALLGVLVGTAVFLCFTPRRARLLALSVCGLAGIGTLFLMRDQSIVDRFMTVFAKAEDRDTAAAGRLDYWQAGLRMVQDHPLGAGGDGYRNVYGVHYLNAMGHQHGWKNRAVHNGFINEACQWGIQGWILRMGFLLAGVLLVVGRMQQLSRDHQLKEALIGATMLAGLAAFCVTSVFADILDNEWGYWLIAMIAAYDRVYLDSAAQPLQLYRLVPISQVMPTGSGRPAEAFPVSPPV